MVAIKKLDAVFIPPSSTLVLAGFFTALDAGMRSRLVYRSLFEQYLCQLDEVKGNHPDTKAIAPNIDNSRS